MTCYLMCCISCVLSYLAYVTMGPCRLYQKDLLLTGRAKVSSWPSHHALSVGSQECAGMWAPTGGEVLLRDRHQDTTAAPRPPPISIVFLSPPGFPDFTAPCLVLVFRVSLQSVSEE